ncbi:MAG TPA: hypothetical protein VMD92_15235 [Acidobacteriaceae bacterium]|nr:hypothetical protein [Acidobacteriaceae bacterium]
MNLQLGNGTTDLEKLGRDFDNSIEESIILMSDVLKIRNRLGQPAPLIANPAQELYTGKAWKQQRNIVLKARQMGITTWIAGQFFMKTITHPGTVTVQVAHTQEAAEQIFRIVHRFLSQLPPALREGALKSAKLSARRLLIPELDSEYLVETAGDRNAGRGLTITNLHCTELARWPGNAAETLYGLMATLSPAGTLVMESTPMGASGCFFSQWRDAEKTNTVTHFFPWWLEPAYEGEPVLEESLTDEERELMNQHPILTLGKIAYRRRLRETFRGTARQEYAEDPDSCFLSSGSCYFDTAAVHARLRELPPVVEEVEKTGLRVWFAPTPGNQYLVAVDPAGGGADGDFTVIQVIDLKTGMQCAEAAEHMTLAEAACQARSLALRYNEAIVAVERNGLGEAVIAHLNGLHPRDRLFRDADGLAGWKTTEASRDQMLGKLEAVLAQNPKLYSSERMLHEFRTFVRHPSGKYAAQAGAHDDCVMAMAVALGARHEYLSAERFRRDRLARKIAGGPVS